MATNKAKTSAPKLAAPKAVDAAEKSSVTAVAASASAVGAAGGVNPGTNSPSAPAASTVNEAQPAAGTPLAQPDSTGTAPSEADKTLPPGGDTGAASTVVAEQAQVDGAKGSAIDDLNSPEVPAQNVAAGVLGEATRIDDDIADALRAAAEPRVLFEVRARQPRGFYRGGKFWPSTWTAVRQGDLSADQIHAVINEPMLEARDPEGDDDGR